MPTPIDHTSAERLREAFGDVQNMIIGLDRVPEETKLSLIIYISNRGFRLVDELEGVIR